MREGREVRMRRVRDGEEGSDQFMVDVWLVFGLLYSV